MTLAPFRRLCEKLARTCRELSGWRRYALALFCGLLVALAFAPYYILPGMALAFPILIFLIDGVVNHLRKSRVAFWIGWWFAFGYLFPSLYWLAFSFVVHATGPGHFAALAVAGFTGVAGLSGFIACFYGLAIMLAARFLWTPGWARVLALVFVWSIAELARSYLLTGLPWNLMGQAFAALAVLAQPAAYVGPFGLGLIVLLIVTAPAALVSRDGGFTNLRPLFLMVGAIVSVLALGFWRLGAGPVEWREDITLQIVQPNIIQQDKINPEKFAENFWRTVERTGADALDAVPAGEALYVIWPENAAYSYFSPGSEAFDIIDSRLPDGALLLSGVMRIEEDTSGERQFFNSLKVIGQVPAPVQGLPLPEGQIARPPSGWATLNTYDKHHLAPFGEYVPFVDVFLALGFGNLVPLGSAFTPGEGPQILPLGLSRVAPIICYETIFTDKIYPRGEGRPDWLVTVTNDAWFGDGAGPRQHLDIARLRSIETGLPMARSANTGISALIGPRGRYLETLPLYTEGSIVSALPQAAPITVFARVRHMLYAAMMCALLALILWQRRISR